MYREPYPQQVIRALNKLTLPLETRIAIPVLLTHAYVATQGQRTIRGNLPGGLYTNVTHYLRQFFAANL